MWKVDIVVVLIGTVSGSAITTENGNSNAIS